MCLPGESEGVGQMTYDEECGRLFYHDAVEELFAWEKDFMGSRQAEI
jgi:hypothetical protein